MKEEISEFEKLYALNVNDKTDQKTSGKTTLTYLSWAWAWAEFVKVYPSATYEIVKNENGLPYFADSSGAMVYTKVKAGNLTHEMWLPVMDGANRAMKSEPYEYQTKYDKKRVEAYSMFDVNKTVMRCLVKNLAMFGLGLYIYAGEDLPEGEEAPKLLREVLLSRGFTIEAIKDFYELHGVTNAGYAEQLVKNPELESMIKSFHAQPKSA